MRSRSQSFSQAAKVTASEWRGSAALLIPLRHAALVGAHACRLWWGGASLWLWWEMLHVGNYSWQALQSSLEWLISVTARVRAASALCASLSHSCGEGGKPLQPLISARSPLRKNNNKLLAFRLYGTWLLCVLISGLQL